MPCRAAGTADTRKCRDRAEQIDRSSSDRSDNAPKKGIAKSAQAAPTRMALRTTCRSSPLSASRRPARRRSRCKTRHSRRAARPSRAAPLFRWVLRTSTIGCRDSLRAALEALERGRLQNSHPDNQADADEQDTQQERNTPAPRQKLIFRHAREPGEDRGREEQSSRDADLRPASIESALTRRSVLHRHQHRAAPFAADSESLCETQEHQHDGGPGPICHRLAAGRSERGDTHDDQCQDEHRLASDPVAVVADDDPANRAGENPTAYVPNAASVPVSGSKVGKNSRLKTSAAAVRIGKSYHSMVVPSCWPQRRAGSSWCHARARSASSGVHGTTSSAEA